jgi:hypothetical protein
MTTADKKKSSTKDVKNTSQNKGKKLASNSSVNSSKKSIFKSVSTKVVSEFLTKHIK